MSFNTWTPHAVSSEAFNWSKRVWRIVEAQHIASSMKLVDSVDEQEVLELLLEQNKPRAIATELDLDYLFSTPFRYNPKRGGSRFRSEIDPGVFYGAESIQTAGAELSYWRWRFLRDSIGLERLGPVAQTVFSCAPTCTAIDLREPPFLKDEATWRDVDSYIGTQEIGRIARKAKIDAIVYESVRSASASWCIAILTPHVFVGIRPEIEPHTWFLSAYQDHVILKSQEHFYEYSFRS